ncbi:hypothetical protein IMG5_138480 [Ichthyophthirius multifiliis]|uniref:Uncharacterized protein n=1 Tax=Ichthyophthirius multifiliis TaxID=5932 RepID=G0QX64_ICHMU|nr:hypothetical protein IMG5_138480 [Ichthyophthirius multifiliis]EGR30195.1 hypothetical protein IMG5_138480 [Ichthyophthirius multifiliis]|eukprot:XP_004031791.1 hypothetical protein IMG5_138480 [Ichthyophthirius multifiliis]
MSGTSSRNFLHLKQLVKSQKFQKFDFGNKEKNIEIYGNETPQEYQIQNIEENVHLFYGEYDMLTVQPDINWLYEKLKERKGRKVTWNFLKNKGHASFVFDVDCEFMDQIYQILNE